jgi:hypothetical protein
MKLGETRSYPDRLIPHLKSAQSDEPVKRYEFTLGLASNDPSGAGYGDKRMQFRVE